MLERVQSVDCRSTISENRQLGLFRTLIGEADKSLSAAFSGLLEYPNARLIAQSADKRLMAVRVEVSRAAGHGRWDFYRLGADTFLITGDSLFDQPCVERVPGNDWVEFHLRLNGKMRVHDPAYGNSLVVEPNSLLVWRQLTEVEIHDHAEAGKRDTFVSLFYRSERLAALARKHGIVLAESLRFTTGVREASTRYLVKPIDPSLTLVAHSLLHSPLAGGLRLLHAEMKATELLCEVLHHTARSSTGPRPVSEEDLRRLDKARQIVVTQYSPPPLISEIARRIGMSETKLKRAFKDRFGTTIFDMSLDARMRHALELLRCKNMPVSCVALSVGYSHQPSFASAFKKHYGLLPSAAREHQS